MSECARCQKALPPGAARCAGCGAPVGATFDLDLGGATPASLGPLVREGGGQRNTGLRIGADGQLAMPVAAAKLPAGVRSATGLDEDGFDPYEIRGFADFGEPPEAFYLAPLYALRVRKRRAELEADLAQRRKALAALAEQVEDAVVAFAEQARPLAETNPVYARAVAPIAEVEALLFARDKGLSAENEAYKAASAEVDAACKVIEERIAAIEAQSAGLEGELAKLEADQKRVEARAKRIEIDARAAGGTVTGTAALEQRELAAEAERLAPRIEEARSKLDGPRKEKAAAEAELLVVQRRRVEARQRLQRQTATRSGGVEDAHRRLRGALGDFGRTALMDEKFFGELSAARSTVERLVLERQDRERAVKRVEKALAVADEGAVRRGYQVLAVFVALLLVVFVGLPLVRVLTPKAPPPLYPTAE